MYLDMFMNVVHVCVECLVFTALQIIYRYHWKKKFVKFMNYMLCCL